MGVGLAHEVQLFPVTLYHHDALIPGLGRDMAQGLVHIALCYENFVDGASRSQRFDYGVAPLDDFVFNLIIWHICLQA